MSRAFANLISLYLGYLVTLWLISFGWEHIGVNTSSSDFTNIYYPAGLIVATIISKEIRRNWIILLFSPFKMFTIPKGTVKLPKRKPKKRNELKENPLND